MDDINHLLDTLQEGDPVAAEQWPVPVYAELRRLAAAKMSREAPGQTLAARRLRAKYGWRLAWNLCSWGA